MSPALVDRIFRHFFPTRRFASGTTDYPTSLELFTAMVEKLVGQDKWEWVMFDVPDSDGWVQVAVSEGEFGLNFAWPFDDDPVTRLGAHGIEVPGYWQLQYLDAGTAATFAVPARDLQLVASTADAMFQRLFGCAPGYSATAVFE